MVITKITESSPGLGTPIEGLDMSWIPTQNKIQVLYRQSEHIKKTTVEPKWGSESCRREYLPTPIFDAIQCHAAVENLAARHQTC